MMILAALLGAMTLGSMVLVQDEDAEAEGVDGVDTDDDGLERIGQTGITATDVPDDLLSYISPPPPQVDEGAETDAPVGAVQSSEAYAPETEVAVAGPLLPPMYADSGEILSGDTDANAVIGSDGIDQMNGRAGDDTLYGAGGDDYIYGAEGDDALNGDDGDDHLQGDHGDDQLNGGAGNDTGFGGLGHDTLDGGAGNDSLLGAEGADALTGGAGDDALHGGADNDVLHGGTGADTLFGGHGNDIVRGDDDRDVDYLNGGTGDDMLYAGIGDILTGGEGADMMLFGDWSSEADAIEVMDFEPGVDTLLLGYDDTGGEEPEVSLRTSADNGSVIEVLVNGVAAALVHDAPDLSADDIALVAQSALQPAA